MFRCENSLAMPWGHIFTYGTKTIVLFHTCVAPVIVMSECNDECNDECANCCEESMFYIYSFDQ